MCRGFSFLLFFLLFLGGVGGQVGQSVVDLAEDGLAGGRDVHGEAEDGASVEDGLCEIPQNGILDRVVAQEEAEEREDDAAGEHDAGRGVLYGFLAVFCHIGFFSVRQKRPYRRRA